VKENLVKTVGSRFSTIVMWSIEFLIGRVKQSRGRGCRASAFSKRRTTIHKSVQALPIPHPPSPQPQVKSLQQPLTRSRYPPQDSHVSSTPSPTTQSNTRPAPARNRGIPFQWRIIPINPVIVVVITTRRPRKSPPVQTSRPAPTPSMPSTWP
jgi:hypothetical protein